VRHSVALAGRLGLPVVATHPVQFISKDEFIAHEARVCIAEGEMLANAKRVRRFNEGMCFKSQAEMAELFKDLPGALANSVEIAKRCNVTLDAGQAAAAELPDAGHDHRRIPGGRDQEGPGRTPAAAVSRTRKSARRSGRATRRAWSSRTTPSST
jgi:DNA polymerase III alpha subunit